jgi:hypothetical protein
MSGTPKERRGIDMTEQEARTAITEWVKGYFVQSEENALPEVEIVTMAYYKGEEEWTVELEVSKSANNPYVRFSMSDEPGHGLQIINVKY